MAGSGDIVRGEVYTLLGISNTADPLVPADTVRQAINRTVALVAKKLGLGPAWVSPAITTATNTRDYTLTGTVEYEQVIRLVYVTDDQPLEKVSAERIARARAGSTGSGRQFEYAMDRGSTGLVNVYFGHLPAVVEQIKAYVTTMPVPWPAGSATPPTIPFSTTALRVVELLTAEDLGRALGPDKMTALDLSPKVFDGWHATAVELLSEERLTIIRFKQASGPYNYAWFTAWGGC